MLILSFLKTTLNVIIWQTVLYSTCVSGARTLDTNRAMLVYNLYAESFLLSHYPRNVRRLLIKAFKLMHQAWLLASVMGLSESCGPHQRLSCGVGRDLSPLELFSAALHFPTTIHFGQQAPAPINQSKEGVTETM